MLGLALLAGPASALEWQFTPTVGAAATYTDNVNLSHANPQDALILSVTPGFTLQSQGSRRVQAIMNYGLSGVARYSDDNSFDYYHNLGANTKAELVEDFLFFDGSATVSQQQISLLGSPADASYGSANRATVGSYSVSPYIQKRFGTFAQALVRYTLSGALFEDNANTNNITSNALNASLNSGTRFNDLSWGLNYSLRNAATQGGLDTQFEHYGASLGYPLTRHIRAFGTAGYDRNDYVAVSGAGISGSYWTTGLGWSPNRRTSVDASFGNAYYGHTYGFNFSHRSRYSIWTAAYNEGTSDISQSLLNDQAVIFWNCSGTLLPGTGLLPPSGRTDCVPYGLAPPGTVNTTTNGIYISKTFRGGAAWTKGKTSLGLNVFDTRRQYQQVTGQPEDETRGVNATFAYRLQPLTTLNVGLGFSNNRVPAGLELLVVDRNDDYYTASLGVSHQFDSTLTGTLTLRRQQRDSNDPAFSFDENSISASASMRF